jgi:hypothetical protein
MSAVLCIRTGRHLARTALAALVTFALAACTSSSTAPPLPTPPTTLAPSVAATPTPLATPLPTPAPSANQRPVGELRYTPDIGYDGDIHIGVVETVRVNASKFVDPDGDPLFLTVAWGDGRSNHIQCGLCRLEHTYRKHGAFTLRAEVTDLKTRPVPGQVIVRVE